LGGFSRRLRRFGQYSGAGGVYSGVGGVILGFGGVVQGVEALFQAGGGIQELGVEEFFGRLLEWVF
jgi:hypothetical protein